MDARDRRGREILARCPIVASCLPALRPSVPDPVGCRDRVPGGARDPVMGGGTNLRRGRYLPARGLDDSRRAAGRSRRAHGPGVGLSRGESAPVNRQFTALALLLSAAALFLATRSQHFTRASVDGHSLRMLIAGSGAPTVVFENGLG